MVTKVMVSFPEGFLADVDSLARQENRSRSELLREAMRLYMDVRGRKRRPADDPRVQKAIAMQDALAALAAGRQDDSTEELRQWRQTRR